MTLVRVLTTCENGRAEEKFREGWNFFWGSAFCWLDKGKYGSVVPAMIKDNRVTQQRVRTQAGRADDGLGPNSDIGSRLRALYGAVQDEGVPAQLLDLLEKLDHAEQEQAGSQSKRDVE